MMFNHIIMNPVYLYFHIHNLRLIRLLAVLLVILFPISTRSASYPVAHAPAAPVGWQGSAKEGIRASKEKKDLVSELQLYVKIGGWLRLATLVFGVAGFALLAYFILNLSVTAYLFSILFLSVAILTESASLIALVLGWITLGEVKAAGLLDYGEVNGDEYLRAKNALTSLQLLTILTLLSYLGWVVASIASVSL